MRIALSVTLLLVLAGTAHAGSAAVVVPPLRLDVGPAVSMHERNTGAQLVIGVHWASLWPSKTSRIDVGVGVVSTSFGTPDEPGAASDGAIARVAGPIDDPLTITAGYLEVATRPSGNGWWRTWAGARVETGTAEKDGRDGTMVGGALRLSAEVYVPAVGGGNNAMIAGTLAVGVYSEISWRRTDILGDDIGASIGLSMRIPFILAAG